MGKARINYETNKKLKERQVTDNGKKGSFFDSINNNFKDIIRIMNKG